MRTRHGAVTTASRDAFAQVRIIYVNACLMTLGAASDLGRVGGGSGASRRWCSVLLHGTLRARFILLFSSVTRTIVRDDCIVVFTAVRASQKGRRADIENMSECLVVLGLPVITTKNVKCDMLLLVIFKTAILLRCCSGASHFQISFLTKLHPNVVRGKCIILELFGCFGFSNVRILGILIMQWQDIFLPENMTWNVGNSWSFEKSSWLQAS